MSMSEEIRKVILKHLPDEMVPVLKTHLNDAESWRQNLEYTDHQLKLAQKQLEEKDQQIAQQEEKLKEWGELEKREQRAKDREKSLDVTLLRVELQYAKERIRAVEGLVESVFRNPRFVSNSTTEIPVMAKPPWGGAEQEIMKTTERKETTQERQ